VLKTKRPSFAAVFVTNQYEVDHGTRTCDQLTLRITGAICSASSVQLMYCEHGFKINGNINLAVLIFSIANEIIPPTRFWVTHISLSPTMNIRRDLCYL